MPPDIIAPERTTPRSRTGPVARELLHGVQRTEVVRHGVEAAGVHDPGAGALGGRVVGEVDPVHELGLAGQVDVVGAGLRAGGDQRFAVREVGPDGGDHDPGRLGDVGQRGRVGGVGVQQWHVHPEPVADRPSLSRLRPASAQRRPVGACAAR